MLAKVVTAWLTVFIWLMFGSFTLYEIEFKDEQARAQSYCDAKTKILTNITLNDCVWGGVSNTSGQLKPSCESLLQAIEKTSELSRSTTVCRAPECTPNIVNSTSGEVKYEVSSYVWDLPGAFFFCLTACSTIGYGSYVPVTKQGKAFTAVYALFGKATR